MYRGYKIVSIRPFVSSGESFTGVNMRYGVMMLMELMTIDDDGRLTDLGYWQKAEMLQADELRELRVNPKFDDKYEDIFFERHKDELSSIYRLKFELEEALAFIRKELNNG